MTDGETVERVRVAVVGSGFGGIGTAVRLRQAGYDDFVVLERAPEIGGVWRDNRYPGCACDVESRLYSFSFAPNPHWTRRFSPGAEIWRYLRRCADEFGLAPHLRLGHEVEEAAWDAAAARWRIRTNRGVVEAQVLVAAPGALAEPRLPDLPGVGDFRGRVLHSARWTEEESLDGARVAVVGTGASAIQIIPHIQPRVRRLTVFQRTPAWVIPRRDRALPPWVGTLLQRTPLLERGMRQGLYLLHEGLGLALRHPRLARALERVLRLHLRRQVPDPALRRRLRPDYTIGCKRILLSDDYYPALTQPNVELVSGGAVCLTAGGVVGADGVERAADVVIFATGFHVTDFPFARRILGAAGATLSEVWGASARAHLGTTVAGFPNLFVLQGPNTGLGHSSVLLMIEAQVEHVLNAIRYMDRHALAAVEPRPEAQDAFVREVDVAMTNTVWTTGGCRSWYLDETGRNSTLWPGSVGSFRRRVEPFRPQEYRLHRSETREAAHA